MTSVIHQSVKGMIIEPTYDQLKNTRLVKSYSKLQNSAALANVTVSMHNKSM